MEIPYPPVESFAHYGEFYISDNAFQAFEGLRRVKEGKSVVTVGPSFTDYMNPCLY